MSQDDFLIVLARLSAAALVGAIVGINRELHNKPAGLRTLSLVALGAAAMTIITEHAGAADSMTRTIQGVVTGVGFLGAGSIIRGGEPDSVHGLTTAAAIWVVAGLGIACGLGLWVIAATTLGLTMFVLVTGGIFERALVRWFGRSPTA